LFQVADFGKQFLPNAISTFFAVQPIFRIEKPLPFFGRQIIESYVFGFNPMTPFVDQMELPTPTPNSYGNAVTTVITVDMQTTNLQYTAIHIKIQPNAS